MKEVLLIVSRKETQISQLKSIVSDEVIVLSSGPIEATVDTEIISVNILNIDQDHAGR